MSEPGTPSSWYWDEHWNRSRRGSTPVVLEWEGGRSEGVLFDEGAPKTVAGVLDLLPVTIPMIHAAWSGDIVMSTQRFPLGFTEKENETRLPRVGDMSWDPMYGELAFTYGTAECRMPSGFNTIVVYGSLQTGLDDFAAWCRARRFEGQAEVRLAAA
jgi:hypothetical protein